MLTRSDVDVVLTVPCYNESERLELTYFARLLEAIPRLGLLFVDDGSSDSTFARLTSMTAVLPRSRVVSLPMNEGKANAVRHGMLEACSAADVPTFVGYLDCDGAFSVEDVAAVVTGAFEVTGGSRALAAHFPVRPRDLRRWRPRSILSGAARQVIAADTKWPAALDWQAGFKLYDAVEVRSALEVPFTTRWFPDAEIVARAAIPASAIAQPRLSTITHVAGSRLRLMDAFVIGRDLRQLKIAQRAPVQQSIQ